MEKTKIKKILVFGHSNIGDVCYDMAVIKPVKENFPEASISFVTSPKGEGIGRVIKGISQVIVFDKHGSHRGLSGYFRFICSIRKERFDLMIVLRKMQMHFFLGIPWVIIIDKERIPGKDKHVAGKYMKLLAEKGIQAKGIEFDFKFSRQDLDFAADVFKRNDLKDKKLKIGLMPLAAWPLKCWPIENLNNLIEMLNSGLDAGVVLLGKTGSSQWDKNVPELVSQKAVSLIDKCSLTQSLALIKNLDIFIGPDTSLLHLASCMGVKTIGLYGATDIDFIYPLFDKHNIVSSKAGLECMPCYPGPAGGSCGAHEPAVCMQAITAEEVYNKVKELV